MVGSLHQKDRMVEGACYTIPDSVAILVAEGPLAGGR